MRLKIAVPMMLLLLLCACGAANTTAQTPVRFRTALTEAGACQFALDLTANYGDSIRQFTLDCQGQPGGETRLTILDPEIAQGITATVSGADANVSYDEAMLGVADFPTRPISPMATPYLLVTAWTEGYINALGKEGDLEEVHYLLGYGGRQVDVTTWFQEELPVRAELTDGQQVLVSCEIRDFLLRKKVETNVNETAETDLGGGEFRPSPP